MIKTQRSILSLILAVCMIFSLLPLHADQQGSTEVILTARGKVEGIVGKSINADITISVEGATFKAMDISSPPMEGNVNSWFKLDPAGVNFKLKENVSQGAAQVGVHVSGTALTPVAEQQIDFEIDQIKQSLNLNPDQEVKFTKSDNATFVIAKHSGTITDVTIAGIVGEEILERTIEVTLSGGAKFKQLPPQKVDTWFGNLPSGLNAEIKNQIALDATQAVITITGKPNADSTQPISLNIPSTALVSDQALEIRGVVTAKFDIKPQPSATVGDVRIDGNAYEEIPLASAHEVKITILNTEFKDTVEQQEVTDWFTNIPEGLSAIVKTVGTDKVTVAVQGTPKYPSIMEVMEIKIPAEFTKSGKEIKVVENLNARYNIAALEPFISIADVTIEGTQHQNIQEQYIRLTLAYGKKFMHMDVEKNVTAWFKDAPLGLIFNVKTEVQDDATFVDIKVKGTPTVFVQNQVITVVIPKGVLKNDQSIINVANNNAKFDIKKSDPVSPVEKVATPTFSPDGSAEFDTNVSVSIATATQDAKIYYTKDGSDPSAASTEYKNPIVLDATTTLKAIARKEGMENSDIAQATFTKKVIQPYVPVPPLLDDPIFDSDLNTGNDNSSSLDSSENGQKITQKKDEAKVEDKKEEKSDVKKAQVNLQTKEETIIPELKFEITQETKKKIEKFEDISKDAWYGNALGYAVQKGLMSGVSEKEFAPNAQALRSQVMEIFYRFVGKPKVKGEHNFKDVSKDAYYYDAVVWAANNGITSGKEKDMFGTDDKITRQQLAVFFYRFAKLQKQDVEVNSDLSKFMDRSEVDSYATDALKWAVSTGLIQGMDKQNLNPQGEATRAQIAAIMMRYEALFLQGK